MSINEKVGEDTIAAMRAYENARIEAQIANTPERVKILAEGSMLTNGNRDAEYGPPAVNLAAAGELKAVFRKHLRREISAGELEAIDNVLTKLGRLATGRPKRDTYVDGATYFAIAGEIGLVALKAEQEAGKK